MIKRFLSVFGGFLAILSLAGCSSSDVPKPPLGKCWVNADCPKGYRCVNDHCEDIYFPEYKISQ